jgi:hypothetical protein
VKHIVLEWREGYQQDPRYIALESQLRDLAEAIRAVLAPTAGSGGVIDRAKANVLKTKRARLEDEFRELKATFIVRREIDILDGVPFTEAP